MMLVFSLYSCLKFTNLEKKGYQEGLQCFCNLKLSLTLKKLKTLIFYIQYLTQDWADDHMMSDIFFILIKFYILFQKPSII